MAKVIKKYRMTKKFFAKILTDDGRRVELNSPTDLDDSAWLAKADLLPTQAEEEQAEADRQAEEQMYILKDTLAQIRTINAPKLKETVDEYITRINKLTKPTDVMAIEVGEIIR
jgi:hypothetical protein